MYVMWKIICKLYVILIIQFLHNNFCLDLQYFFEEELFWQICIWCIIMCGLWTSQKIHHTLSTVHLVEAKTKNTLSILEQMRDHIMFHQLLTMKCINTKRNTKCGTTISEEENTECTTTSEELKKNKIRWTIYSILMPL